MSKNSASTKASSGTMANEKPFYAHDKQPAPARPSTAGEHVWTLTKDGHTYRAELRDHAPEFGCELQILFDGELKVAHMHPDREWALTEAKLRAEALRLRDWSPAG